ncbi:MAG: TetR/AcrR family transcriptional regulator [Peptococcaceae bacterium MAG4]|nr:TetR/AcrR family transcriptional regulator [Peptococcaceae bacterium MAG4]
MTVDYRERVSHAFRDMALERGFSRVTVDELAARCGISKRTIYRYFKSKEEMVVTVMEEFMSQIEQEMVAALNSSTGSVEKLSAAIHAVLRNMKRINVPFLYDLEKNYPHLWERVEQFRARKIQQAFEQIFAGDQRGHLKDIEPVIFTTALLAAIRSVVNPRFIMEQNLSPEKTIQSLFEIFLYGIVDEQGKGELKFIKAQG